MFDWLFGSNRKTNYDDTRSLYDDYNNANNQANKFYDENIGGGKWDSLDDQQKYDIANQFSQLDASRQGLSNQYDSVYDMYNQENKDNRYNYFGNGLLGTFLNPIAQTATAGFDLATGNYKDRDAVSDAGALGDTLMTLLPGVGVIKGAGKIGKAMTSVPGMAGIGAGFGASDTLRQGGSETDPNDILQSGIMGGLFGGGLGAAEKYGGRYLQNRGANRIADRALADPNNANLARETLENSTRPSLVNSIKADPRTYGNFGGIYSNAVRSLIPQSTLGKGIALGGLAYGGSQVGNMMGGGQQADPTQQLAQAFTQQYGYEPSEYELQLMMQQMQGGY